VIESPAKVLDLWTSELDALAEEGGMFILTAHPFLSGRASRVATLERLVEHARSRGDLWMTSLGEVAERARATIPAADERPVPVCTIEEDVYGKR
jgi:peptidoglycan/xylan/chitin deacetylase (PgdA/CDA1 family)